MNQIDLTIPDSVPVGCWVPIAVIAGGVISNVATLPINPGGNPGSLVYILGTSGAGPGRAPVSFTCLAHTDDGQFTVPSYILSALPPGAGAIQLQNSISGALPASGLDAAYAGGAVSYSEDGTFK